MDDIQDIFSDRAREEEAEEARQAEHGDSGSVVTDGGGPTGEPPSSTLGAVSGAGLAAAAGLASVDAAVGSASRDASSGLHDSDEDRSGAS